MENLQLCIWGPREGFEVIYSDNQALKEQIKSAESKYDNLFTRLISNNVEFYYLSKFEEYQMYSIVCKSFDKGGRQTFLNISICCQKGIQLGVNTPSTLKKFFDEYKSLYLKNDKHITSSESSIKANFNGLLSEIICTPSNQFLEFNKFAFLLDNDTLLQSEFGKLRGDEVYFISNGSQSLKSYVTKIVPLSEAIKDGANLKQLELLQSYIRNKNNFTQAQSLFAVLSDKLSDLEIAEFTNWKNRENVGVAINQLRSLIAATHLTEADIKFLKSHVDNNSMAYVNLSDNERQRVKQKIDTSTGISIEEQIKQIESQIKQAKSKNWNIDPSKLATELDNNRSLQARLNSTVIDDIKLWETNFNAYQENESIRRIDSLHAKIKSLTDKKILSQLRELETELTAISSLVVALSNNKKKQELLANEKYEYLISKSWIPKDRKPLIIKVVLSVVILGLFAGGFYGIQRWKVGQDRKAKLDSDNDGIVDGKDKDLNTSWLRDTSLYKLKDYVTSEGIIDTDKTKVLCACWKFPNAADRVLLKCKNDTSWFQVNDTLYKFHKSGPADGTFYSSADKKVKSGNDDEIEETHKKLFPEFYNPNKPPVPEISEVPTPDDNNTIITITYLNKQYKLKKGFTTATGMKFNNANYRYQNKAWKVQSNPPNGNWKVATEADINYLLARKATVVPNNEEVTPVGVEIVPPPKEPTAAEIKSEQTKLNYWNKVFAYSDEAFKANKDEIKGRLKSNDWKSSTKDSDADKAKAKVKTRYQALVGVL